MSELLFNLTLITQGSLVLLHRLTGTRLQAEFTSQQSVSLLKQRRSVWLQGADPPVSLLLCF